jgi:hypothetical protein
MIIIDHTYSNVSFGLVTGISCNVSEYHPQEQAAWYIRHGGPWYVPRDGLKVIFFFARFPKNKSNTPMLHDAGVFTNIYPQNDPFLWYWRVNVPWVASGTYIDIDTLR